MNDKITFSLVRIAKAETEVWEREEFCGNTEVEHQPTALQENKGILRTAGVREQQKTEDLGLVQQTLEQGVETVEENSCY